MNSGSLGRMDFRQDVGMALAGEKMDKSDIVFIRLWETESWKGLYGRGTMAASRYKR